MRPLITPLKLRLHRRHVKQAIFTTAATVLILLALLPTLLSLALRYQIPKMGLGQVEIGNIDINPFRGRLLLEQVELYRSAARLFSVQRVELDLAMLSLLEHRLQIQSLWVEGMELTVKQGEGVPLQIAGFALPATTTDAAPDDAPVAQPGAPWGIGIDTFVMNDSALNLIHPHFPETLRLERLELGALATWRPDFPTPASLQLGLREGVVKLSGRVRPFSQKPHHQLELEMEGLPLAALDNLAQPVVTQLAGNLSTRMAIELQQEGGILALKQQGELSLTDLQLQGGGHRLSQRGLSWKGTVTIADLARPETTIVAGGLDVTELALMPASGDSPYLSLGRLSLHGIDSRGGASLAINDITIDSLQAEVVRRKEGVWLTGMPSPQDAAATTATTTETATAAATDAPPFHFKNGKLRLVGENRLGFDDQTVKPPFHHALIITEAEVLEVDTSRPQQPTRVKIQAKDDFYTTIDIEGEGRPFAEGLSLRLKAKLQNYDMPPASPYLAQLLGYRITTGQLEGDVTLSIENEELAGEVGLAMNQLQLKPEDPARIEETQSQLTLPLNTALSLLRDSDDNITLTLPISGRLDDPQFALDDIINTALGKALKAGSVSYLKHLLQPYGSLITIIQLAGKASGNIQLDPVRFAAGSSELTVDTEPYLERLAGLMKEKGGINMRLCGFATAADLGVISKSKEKVIPPSGHPGLEALARQRAEAIKARLVNSHGVAAKQLFICHPELDMAAEATARVELEI